jgi:hypothetical protein
MLRLGLIALAAAEEPSVRAGWQDGFKVKKRENFGDNLGLKLTVVKFKNLVEEIENFGDKSKILVAKFKRFSKKSRI